MEGTTCDIRAGLQLGKSVGIYHDMRIVHVFWLVVLLTFGSIGCSQPESQISDSQIDDFVAVELSGVDPEVYEFLIRKQRAVQDLPDSSSAIGELAMAYEMNGFADSALVGYRQAAALAPTNAKWPYFESLVLASFGDYEVAIEALDRALALDATYAAGWIWKGRLHLELNELSEATNAFQQALEMETQTAAIVGLAQVALRKHRAEYALELLQSLDQFPIHPHVEQLVRIAKTRLGKSDDLKSPRSTAIPGQVGFPDPLSLEKRSYEVSLSAELTRFRNLLTQPEGQRAAFNLIDTLFEEYPDNKRVVIAKAHQLRLEGDVANLRTLIEQAHSKWPTEINFILGLAELEIDVQNSARALQLIDQALQLEPKNVWGLLQKGIALAQSGDFNQALDALQHALKIDETAEIHYYIGRAFAELADFSNAWCHMQRAVELAPELTQAVEQLRRLDDIALPNARDEINIENCGRVAQD